MQNQKPIQKDIYKEVRELRDDFVKCVLGFVEKIYPRCEEILNSYPELLPPKTPKRRKIQSPWEWKETLRKWREDYNQWFKKHPFSKRFYTDTQEYWQWVEKHPLLKQLHEIVQRFNDLRGEKYLPEVLTFPWLPHDRNLGVVTPQHLIAYIDCLNMEFQVYPRGHATLKSFVFDALINRLDEYIQRYYPEIAPATGTETGKAEGEKGIKGKIISTGNIINSNVTFQQAGTEAKQNVTTIKEQGETGGIKSYLPFVSPIIEFFKLIFSFFKPSG